MFVQNILPFNYILKVMLFTKVSFRSVRLLIKDLKGGRLRERWLSNKVEVQIHKKMLRAKFDSRAHIMCSVELH